MKLFQKVSRKKFHPAKKVSNPCKDMPKQAAPINARQKAAVFALAAGILADWTECFIAASENRTKEAEKVAATFSNVSHWKSSKKIRDYYDECRERIARDQARIQLQGIEEGKREAKKESEEETTTGENERTKTKRPAAIVDYYDPANQRTQINRIIAESGDDPKTQLDAIKAIQQTQRDDKQAARDQKQVRSYLPLRCESCPLYAKARAKTTK